LSYAGESSSGCKSKSNTCFKPTDVRLLDPSPDLTGSSWISRAQVTALLGASGKLVADVICIRYRPEVDVAFKRAGLTAVKAQRGCNY